MAHYERQVMPRKFSEVKRGAAFIDLIDFPKVAAGDTVTFIEVTVKDMKPTGNYAEVKILDVARTSQSTMLKIDKYEDGWSDEFFPLDENGEAVFNVNTK